MTPKQKAKYLYDKMIANEVYVEPLSACHVLVDELIECTHEDEWQRKRTKFDKQYWQQVKQELEKL